MLFREEPKGHLWKMPARAGILVVSIFWTLSTWGAADGSLRWIPDLYLERALGNAIGKPSRTLTNADIEDLTSLRADNAEIQNLAGLERAVSLVRLDLSYNRIEDLRPLAGLHALAQLSLVGNRVEDLEPLAELKQLKQLYLSSNRFQDAGPLASLKKLEILDLSFNRLREIRPITKLRHLQQLTLGHNHIEHLGNLSGLINLQNLDVSNNLLTNVRFVADLTALAALDITGNHLNLRDDSPTRAYLKTREENGLTAFLEPQAGWVRIFDQALERALRQHLQKPQGKLSPLDLEHTESLNLSGAEIEDIRGLHFASGLSQLNLSKNRIRDITPLEELAWLKDLDLSENQIDDLTALESRIGMRSLDLSHNRIVDLRPQPSHRMWVRLPFGQG